jgi:MoaA/NifB/PqqE/SkfB family radical SAM enzyme
MRLEDIGFYTLEDRRAAQASMSSPLWRCELILTDRCNFRCPYCRTMREDCQGEMPFDRAREVVQYWCDQGLKNVRFSGGEPSLYNQIFDLVRLAKDGGVEHVAVSSNGSADLSWYYQMTLEGVNDWSISLDACCAQMGDRMAGRAGKWSKVIENIKALSEITYVTVGIVFTEENVKDARETIEFADSLGVSDIRVISSAQYNEAIEELAKLPDELMSRHPILKYRVGNHMAGRRMRGIRDSDNHRCPLALDDMAVAGNSHFPCIIYMRERGAPIGTLDDYGKVRADRARWAQEHDCYADPICSANCLDVCVDYNNRYKEYNGAERLQPRNEGDEAHLGY